MAAEVKSEFILGRFEGASGLRLFRLPRQLGKLEFRIDFFFPLLYSYYKKSGSTPLPNELKIVDTIVLKG